MNRDPGSRVSPLGLTLFGVVNILLITGFYALWQDEMLRQIHISGAATDKLSYRLFSVAVAASLCIGAWGVAQLCRLVLPSRATMAVVVLLQTVAVVLVAIDTKSFLVLGVHLDDPVVFDALKQTGLLAEMNLGATTWAAAIAFALGVAGAEFFVLWVSNWIGLRGGSAIHAMLLCFGVAAIVVPSYRLDRHRSSDWRSVGQGQLGAAFMRRMATGNETVVAQAMARGTRDETLPTLSRKQHILFVMVESWRADALNQELMPNLSRFASEGHCSTITKQLSNSHVTEYGVFSALYGTNAYRYGAFGRDRVSSYPFDVFRKNGYRLFGASTSRLQAWKGAGFMTEQFDAYQEITDWKPNESDSVMIQWARNLRSSHDFARTPAFVFLFLSSSHHNYYFPESAARYHPYLPEDYNHFQPVDELEKVRSELYNRYRNSIVWVDSMLGELLDAYRDLLDRGELAIVVTGDHGEEFWDQGAQGHAAPTLVTVRSHTPLVLCLGGSEIPVPSVSSHADLMPTLLEYSGASSLLASESPMDGRSLLEANLGRTAIVNAYGAPELDPRFVITDGTQKVFVALDNGTLRVLKTATIDDVPLDAPPSSAVTEAMRRLGDDLKR